MLIAGRALAELGEKSSEVRAVILKHSPLKTYKEGGLASTITNVNKQIIRAWKAKFE